MIGVRILTCAVLLTASTSCSPRLYEGKYEPLGKVPPSFLATYPQGSQVRSMDAVQAVFEKHQKEFRDLFLAAQSRDAWLRGRMNIAVALEPSGTVAAVALIESELKDATLEKALMVQVGLLKFGPAPGNGLFVFWYPLRFVPQ